MKIVKTSVVDRNGFQNSEMLKSRKCKDVEDVVFEFVFYLARFTDWNGTGEVLFLPVYNHERKDGRFDHVPTIVDSSNNCFIGFKDTHYVLDLYLHCTGYGFNEPECRIVSKNRS